MRHGYEKRLVWKKELVIFQLMALSLVQYVANIW